MAKIKQVLGYIVGGIILNAVVSAIIYFLPLWLATCIISFVIVILLPGDQKPTDEKESVDGKRT
jgi:hypothetical protein